jgi:DNA-binding CsgD family transcriptional regulator
MPRLPDDIVSRTREVEADLGVFVDGGPPALEIVPSAVCELLSANKALVYTLRPGAEGVCLDQGFCEGLPREAIPVLDAYISGQTVAWAAYNPTRPEPRQRNKTVGVDEIVRFAGVQKREEIPICRDLFARGGLDSCDELRVLVCDGPSLLAWVGAFREAPFTELERRTLQRIVPALQRRLCVERTLTTASCTRMLLDAALTAIPAPAFVTDALGHVLEANATGQLWLQREGSPGRQRLGEATRLGADPEFEITPVAATGVPGRSLLVQRAGSEGTARYRAARAAARWSLSRRQSEVLALVVDGVPTRTMAAVLQVSERCVEAHLTAIFEKAQVESRAELAVAVWRG